MEGGRRVVGQGERVATDPEYSGKMITLRETLQTRRTDNQELDPLDFRWAVGPIYRILQMQRL
jgi:hypothetical protein